MAECLESSPTWDHAVLHLKWWAEDASSEQVGKLRGLLKSFGPDPDLDIFEQIMEHKYE